MTEHVVNYRCPVCWKMITETWNDEIARAELKRDFPEDAAEPEEELVRVCDPCYTKIKDQLGVKIGRTLQ